MQHAIYNLTTPACRVQCLCMPAENCCRRCLYRACSKNCWEQAYRNEVRKKHCSADCKGGEDLHQW